jgi:glutathione reductase (NADPH)
MVYASHYREDFEAAQGFGWSRHDTAKHNWHKFMQAKDKEITRCVAVVRRSGNVAD